MSVAAAVTIMPPNSVVTFFRGSPSESATNRQIGPPRRSHSSETVLVASRVAKGSRRFDTLGCERLRRVPDRFGLQHAVAGGGPVPVADLPSRQDRPVPRTW